MVIVYSLSVRICMVLAIFFNAGVLKNLESEQKLTFTQLDIDKFVDAVTRANLPEIKKYIGVGADKNMDIGGWRPIHYALVFRYGNMIDYLLQKKIDIEMTTLCGRTPLHFAVIKSQSLKIVQQIVDYGARRHVTDVCGKTPLDYAEELGYEDIINYFVAKNNFKNNLLTHQKSCVFSDIVFE